MNGKTQHPILSSFFGLNEPFSKNIIVGLETSGDGDFVAIIRIIPRDNFIGLAFTQKMWMNFQEKFPEIDEFFRDPADVSKGDIDIDNIYLRVRGRTPLTHIDDTGRVTE